MSVCLNEISLKPWLSVCACVWRLSICTWTVTLWPPPSGALQIENSEESDQGKYECVAVNSAGTRYSAPANLYVRGKIPLDSSKHLLHPPFRSPPPTAASSLAASSAPMLCLPTADWKLGPWIELQWKWNLLMPVRSLHTLSFPAFSISLFFSFSSFCSNAVLLVCLTYLTWRWWGDVLTRQGWGRGWLRFCLFVLRR